MTLTEAKALALVAVGKIEAKSAVDQQQRDAMRQSMLTDEEAENLILSVMRQRGDRGATEQEVTDMLNECISARFISCCVDLAAKGLVDIDFDPTQPVNDRLVFKQRTELSDTIKDVLRRRVQGGQ